LERDRPKGKEEDAPSGEKRRREFGQPLKSSWITTGLPIRAGSEGLRVGKTCFIQNSSQKGKGAVFFREKEEKTWRGRKAPYAEKLQQADEFVRVRRKGGGKGRKDAHAASLSKTIRRG